MAPQHSAPARSEPGPGTDDIPGALRDLPGTRLEVTSWMSGAAARSKYGATPDWDAQMILETFAADPSIRERCAGRSWHVGEGIWLSTCGYCDAYVFTAGSQPVYSTIGPHMVEAHGAQVPGINVSMLP